MYFKISIRCLLLIAATSHLSTAQPNLDSVPIPGLRQRVEVVRDRWGVNHIYAGNEYDLFFTQGYCAARDRLFQFEIWRRQATGTLSEILGDRELKRDIGARLFAYRGDMRKELAHYHSRGESIIRAFVDGINARIAECLRDTSQLPFEFRVLGIRPGRWTPEVVVSRHQGIRSNVQQELNIARAIARIGADSVRKLVWFHPLQPDLRIDSSIRTDLLFDDILGPYLAVNREVSFASRPAGREPGSEGSNNWVIHGTRTASGMPILANDPHRRISVPSLRYIVHLSAPGWDVIGGGEPVIPGVSIGHNTEGAWGLTIFETDAEDLYVYDIDPANPDRYRFGNGWRQMRSVRETFHVKGGRDTTLTLRFTHHGPVTHIDRKHNKAYAIRCAWLEPGGAPYLASLRIDQAKRWDEFRDACAYSHIPGENMIWADRKGNIGWQAVGITPIRSTHSGMVPVPGDGRFEWKGFLPIKERPHLLNPNKGFFATANQHVTPDGYAHMTTLNHTWADPFRGNRANEVLARMTQADIEGSKALQTDYTCLPARQLLPLLSHAEPGEERAKAAWRKILEWDHVLDKNSIAAAIYVAWERELMTEARRRFVPASVATLLPLQLSTVIPWLQDPGPVFGAEAEKKRDVMVMDCFIRAVDGLRRQLGPDMQAWRYGQPAFKHIRIEHPLSGLLDADTRRDVDLGPLPRGGYGHTPGSTGAGNNQTTGASFRFITDLSDWDKAVFTNTPGQSGDPESPFYKNLFESWADDKYFPAPYSRKAVLDMAAETSILTPVASLKVGPPAGKMKRETP
ncbi:MAG: penicillin acylase family protein [Chitinophagia bacterium]|nr:penicillin acylase family protein [Chitinophagia bacterium]